MVREVLSPFGVLDSGKAAGMVVDGALKRGGWRR